MSVEVACSCDGLPAHSHVYRQVPITNTQHRIVAMRTEADAFDVRVWVDWKAVAREMCQRVSRRNEDRHADY